MQISNDGYYEIYTADDFRYFCDNVSTLTGSDNEIKGRLMNDIDLSAYPNWIPMWNVNSYDGAAATNQPKLVFDGNNKVVKNLYQTSNAIIVSGLFGCIIKAHIYNLGVEDIYVVMVNRASALGTSWGNTSAVSVLIEDCYVTGISVSTGSYVCALLGGGIAVTRQDKFVVKRCYVNGEINGGNRIGGIIGHCGDIYDSVSVLTHVTITANSYIGRLTGQFTRVSNSYATIVPETNWSSINNSGGANGTTITAEQASSQSFYEELGWDFQNIWQMVDGSPRFRKTENRGFRGLARRF